MNRRSRSSSSGANRISLIPVALKTPSRPRRSNSLTTGNRRPSGSAQNHLQASRQSRRSSFNQWMSPRLSAASSRGSGYGRTSATDNRNVVDPRPLTDRSFQSQRLSELVMFLVENGYPGPTNKITLTNFTKKDFEKIFEFLYQWFVPKYQASFKIEEEVPHLMKQLGYPFTITKASLMTIGSPHSWPACIGALSWLLNVCKYSVKVKLTSSVFSGDGFDSDEMCMRLHQDIAKSYERCLAGAEDNDSEFLKKFGKQGYTDEYIRELEIKEEHLELVKQEMEHEMVALSERIAELSDQKYKTETDIKNYNAYIEKMEKKTREELGELKDIEEEHEKKVKELSEIESEMARLQLEVKEKQGMAQKVKQLKAKKEHLSHLIHSENGTIEEIKKSIWNQQVAFSTINDKLNVCSKFETIYQQLQLAIAALEKSPNQDVQYHLGNKTNWSDIPDFDPSDKYHLLHSKIKPYLTRLNRHLQCVLDDMEIRIMNSHQHNQQLQATQMEAEEKIARLKRQHNQMLKESEIKRNALKEEYNSLQEQCDAIREKMRLLQGRLLESDAEKKRLEAKLRSLDTKIESTKSEHAKYYRESKEMLTKMIEKYKELALMVETDFSKIHEEMNAFLSACRDNEEHK